MRVRYATAEDVKSWYGSVPATMRAVVVEDEGHLVGIAGIARMGDHLQAYSEIKDELRSHPYLLAKASVMIGKMIRDANAAVLAVCSESEPTAPSLLSRLGFAPVDGVWRHG
jgi:hypothetical protein